MDYRHVSTVEVNKIIRKQLKTHFPGIKFSVRKRGGVYLDAVDIEWTDGPTDKQVEAVVSSYQNGGFDGMIDMQYYSLSWLLPDGSAMPAKSSGTTGSAGTVSPYNYEKPDPEAELVSFGSNFVFTHRNYSVKFLEKIKALQPDVIRIDGYEIPAPEIKTHAFDDNGWFKYVQPDPWDYSVDRFVCDLFGGLASRVSDAGGTLEIESTAWELTGKNYALWHDKGWSIWHDGVLFDNAETIYCEKNSYHVDHIHLTRNDSEILARLVEPKTKVKLVKEV